jgi:hypothetical protein
MCYCLLHNLFKSQDKMNIDWLFQIIKLEANPHEEELHIPPIQQKIQSNKRIGKVWILNNYVFANVVFQIKWNLECSHFLAFAFDVHIWRFNTIWFHVTFYWSWFSIASFRRNPKFHCNSASIIVIGENIVKESHLSLKVTILKTRDLTARMI